MEDIRDFPVRDDLFDVEFPLFIIVKKIISQPAAEPGKFDVSFSDPVTLTTSDGLKVIPVFTDRLNAEQFVAAHGAGHKVFVVPEPSAMIRFLTSCTAIATHVGFDPYRIGIRGTTRVIDDFIRELKRVHQSDSTETP